MVRARETILRLGGASRANVFTRIALAIFEQLPWRAVPFLPVEIVLLPRWFPFHLYKVSYWSRTVMVPLLILYTFKARARNPKKISIRELFDARSLASETTIFPLVLFLIGLLLVLDRLGLKLYPLMPRWLRRRAIKKAEAWILEQLNGAGGLGAIFPAMINAYEALEFLGYPAEPSAASCKKDKRSRICWWSVSTALIASLACRRCGIARGLVSRFRRSATSGA